MNDHQDGSAAKLWPELILRACDMPALLKEAEAEGRHIVDLTMHESDPQRVRHVRSYSTAEKAVEARGLLYLGFKAPRSS